MRSKEAHLSQRDLVLFADGELADRARRQAGAHLDACWSCRERLSALQGAILSFVRERDARLNAELPASAPVALFRARLAEAAAASEPSRWKQFAMAGLAFAGIVAGILIISVSTVNAEGPKPRLGLTPGETRPITLAQVCADARAEVVTSGIPEETQRRVFAAYGVAVSQRDQFEVDYLITPDLGGTESVRNLWPQPYSVRWNARVKDRLEQRLHELVCSGEMDLATAQRAIAVDWIGAYKKYVR